MTQYGIHAKWVRSDAITEADTGTTVSVIDIPAKTLVTEVVVVVTEVFAGGSPLLDVGDGDGADDWADQADITATTKGSYKGTGGNGAANVATGKYYESADTIDVVVSAALTNGTAYVLAHMIELDGLA